MNNEKLIFLTQKVPSYLGRYLRIFKTSLKKKEVLMDPSFLGDVDHFKTTDPKYKRALFLFRPSAWLVALTQYPNIKLYNNSGFIYSVVKSLNLNGYVVDIIDPRDGVPTNKNYDLCIAHGGYCQKFLEKLEDHVTIFQYVSGLYWKSFIEESNERYLRFNKKHEINQRIVHRRKMADISEGEEYLTHKANKLFTIHCPRMIDAYGSYAHKFHFTGLGAYIDPLFNIDFNKKDYDRGLSSFLYVGGSGGNLQKGLDLLIEVFVKTPDLHLYIYCKVEEEIMSYSQKELNAPNIHYIYHWRYKPFHNRLKTLLKAVNFTVHAPINIGMGTAYMATLGVGMIPVGYVDVPDDGKHCAVLTDSWQVKDLVDCICEASAKSPEWCAQASLGAVQLYKKHCDPKQVEHNMKKMFAEVGR